MYELSENYENCVINVTSLCNDPDNKTIYVFVKIPSKVYTVYVYRFKFLLHKDSINYSFFRIYMNKNDEGDL